MAASSTVIPVEEYLSSSFEPDAEYVDGEVEERPMGEYDHATWQTMLAAFFTMRQVEWGIKARTELKLRTGRNYRVPDVMLLSREAPVEKVVTHPPLAVFEILSPEDRMTRVLKKLAEYDRIGVGAIWVIEPTERECYRYASGELRMASLFVLPGTNHQVEMAEIMAMLD
jgi:Uma2 family endonuclease